MRAFEDGSVGYGGEESRLLFVKGEENYVPQPTDLYWKISLAVPNIELAYEQLTDRGVDIGQPQQFGDIAYLAHFKDPEGFTIELLDHWFKDERPEDVSVNSDLFGGGAHLNLLTLRSTDIETDMQSCLNSGMKLLSIMPVELRGFTLYFFAYTTDIPPNSDARAVDNRTWVFRRKYTVLEIQHLHNSAEIIRPEVPKAGYVGTTVSGSNSEIPELLLSQVETH